MFIGSAFLSQKSARTYCWRKIREFINSLDLYLRAPPLFHQNDYDSGKIEKQHSAIAGPVTEYNIEIFYTDYRMDDP